MAAETVGSLATYRSRAKRLKVAIGLKAEVSAVAALERGESARSPGASPTFPRRVF